MKYHDDALSLLRGCSQSTVPICHMERGWTGANFQAMRTGRIISHSELAGMLLEDRPQTGEERSKTCCGHGT
jgi:hypothetical protein